MSLSERAQRADKASSTGNRVLTVVSVALCVVLVPLLVVNVAALVRGEEASDEMVRITGLAPMVILTGSMEPAIEEGDLILCTRVPAEDVQVGDVISFEDSTSGEDVIVTHRVVAVEGSGDTLAWRTKGDANNVQDEALVPASNLVARYTGLRVPGGGTAVQFLKTPVGFGALIVVAVALVTLVEVVGSRRAKRDRGVTAGKKARATRM